MFTTNKVRFLCAATLMIVAHLAGAGTPAPVPHGTYYSESSMRAPLLLSQRPTTDGRIYINNLDASISSLQDAIDQRPAGLLQLRLARNLYHRFRIGGKLSDLELARGMAEKATSELPQNAEAWLLLAKLQASFHEFDLALSSLKQAEKFGGKVDSISIVRYEIEHGKNGGLTLTNLSALPDPQHLVEFVQRANTAINQGQLRTADELLTQAQYHYRDSNPFPIAWLHVQHGIAFLRFGDTIRAQKFFQAARERLPSYYLATEHLAETELLLGNAEAAALLYQEVYLQTANPEFLGGLALAQAQLNDEQAEANLQQAKREYIALLNEHPAMYTQHAAKFFLKLGDANKALKLAKSNLRVRQDIQSNILFASAAAEAGNTLSACQSLHRSLDSGARPPELLELQYQLNSVCQGGNRMSN